MLLASEIERLVCTFRREITSSVLGRAGVCAGKSRSSGRMILTRKRVGERSLQVDRHDRELFAIQRDLKVG